MMVLFAVLVLFLRLVVLRDHNGIFIFWYASALNPCNVIEAELHAISLGLRLAGLKGFREVEIEFDSLFAVRCIKEGCSSCDPLFNLISDIQDHLRVAGDFCINHVLRVKPIKWQIVLLNLVYP